VSHLTFPVLIEAPFGLDIFYLAGERTRRRWKSRNASGSRRTDRNMQSTGWMRTCYGIRLRVWMAGGRIRRGRGWSSGSSPTLNGRRRGLMVKLKLTTSGFPSGHPCIVVADMHYESYGVHLSCTHIHSSVSHFVLV